MSEFHESEQDTERAAPGFTLRDVLSIVFQHWKLIATTSLVVCATLGAGLFYLPPTYVAEGKLLIQTERQASPSFFGGIAAYRETRDTDPANRRLETEMELLATRGVSEKVVTSLGLRYEDVFHPAYVHLLNPVADVYDRVAQKLFDRPPKDRYGSAATVKDFNKSFTVAPLKSRSADTTSNIISVQLRAPNPEIAQEGLARLMSGYVAYTGNLNQASGLEAYRVVRQNLVDATGALDRAQGRLRSFLARAPLTAEDIASPMRNVQMKIGAEEGPGAAAELPVAGDGAIDETVLRTLRARLADMEVRLAEMRRSYQDNSEPVVKLVRGAEDIRKRIRTATAQAAEQRTMQMQLEREVRVAEEQHGELHKKLGQIALFLAANPGQADVRAIIEPPTLPTSSEWRKSLLLWVLGSVGGVVLGFGLAGMLAYTDHSLQTAQDVRRYLGLDLLATVPALPDRERLALESVHNAGIGKGVA